MFPGVTASSVCGWSAEGRAAQRERLPQDELLLAADFTVWESAKDSAPQTRPEANR